MQFYLLKCPGSFQCIYIIQYRLIFCLFSSFSTIWSFSVWKSTQMFHGPIFVDFLLWNFCASVSLPVAHVSRVAWLLVRSCTIVHFTQPDLESEQRSCHESHDFSAFYDMLFIHLKCTLGKIIRWFPCLLDHNVRAGWVIRRYPPCYPSVWS